MADRQSKALTTDEIALKLTHMGLDPGSRFWIPAFAGMTANTPVSVSLLGFNTLDIQMDLYLGMSIIR